MNTLHKGMIVLIGFNGQLLKNKKKLKGISITMHVFNPMHLDHENMQQVVSSRDERWDEI
jgi:hypothetical protein